ncbi:dTDP-4-dehydrorhamnose reductase [Conexibacter sp. DBS9H8]|uniref:dTDP-4-dehydrorhamnose reductase n=1 Tax=Conexibacter sp. DBS9H8 TaxID=2937801 RepID=UPI00200EE409|nr:dTDP-4-dehydrorhamnose reductase [Conexibacter sp. DBS9H8]
MSLRLLITGASGLLGQDVYAVARARGHQVTALTRAALDICDPAAVSAAVATAAPDVVVNCAAYTQVDRAESEPEAAHRVNADGAGTVATAAAAAGAWTVHVSTDYVFSGAKASGPYLESDPTGPQTVYGQSKLAGEAAVAAAAPDCHTIVRSAWLYGTGGPCFPGTILDLARRRPELTVVDDQIGSPTYTPHLAAALTELAESRALCGVVHVAGAGAVSWFGFASALLAAAPVCRTGAAGTPGWAAIAPCTSAEHPRPAARPAFSVLASERAGVPVLPDWRSGVAAYMAAWSAQQVAA